MPQSRLKLKWRDKKNRVLFPKVKFTSKPLIGMQIASLDSGLGRKQLA
jgi:hypothetical protein